MAWWFSNDGYVAIAVSSYNQGGVMKKIGLFAVFLLMGSSVVEAQSTSNCEENLKLVSVQAQEYYADRDTKEKDKIRLRSQLNDAQAQISALKAEVAELKKAAPKAEEPKK